MQVSGWKKLKRLPRDEEEEERGEERRMRNLRKPELLRDELRDRKQREAPGHLEGYTRGTKGRKGDRTQKMLTCWRD